MRVKDNADKIAILRRMAEQGYSSSRIAEALHTTRSSVCGHAFRLGIQLKSQPRCVRRATPGPKPRLRPIVAEVACAAPKVFATKSVSVPQPRSKYAVNPVALRPRTGRTPAYKYRDVATIPVVTLASIIASIDPYEHLRDPDGYLRRMARENYR